MSNWGMNFDNYVPRMGRRIPEGSYSVELAHTEADTVEKGDRIRLTFKVTSGEYEGSTISTTLYILNDRFRGTEGHAGATRDNWYHLLVAAGVKPSNFGDMRQVADALMGRRLGIDVVHTKGKGQNADKVYANIDAFFPAAALGTESAPAPAVPVDTDDTSDDGDDGVTDMLAALG